MTIQDVSCVVKYKQVGVVYPNDQDPECTPKFWLLMSCIRVLGPCSVSDSLHSNHGNGFSFWVQVHICFEHNETMAKHINWFHGNSQPKDTIKWYPKLHEHTQSRGTLNSLCGSRNVLFLTTGVDQERICTHTTGLQSTAIYTSTTQLV